MPDIKIHAREGQEQFNGFEDCDFRGDKRPTGDEHGEKQKTIFELANASEEQVQRVLDNGPEWNRLTAMLTEGMVPAKILGVDVGQALSIAGAGDQLRIGVFDD